MAEYCRRRGIYPEQLEQWRADCEQASERADGQRSNQEAELRAQRKRIKALERELQRKESALAETAALLTLRKKAQAIWGGRNGRMISTPDRRKAINLIDEARENGARLKPACSVLGIAARTYQRWTRVGATAVDGRAIAVRSKPAHAMTPEEEAAAIALCTCKRDQSLPPAQIVAQEADAGRYIASESTLYRLLRRQAMNTPRGRGR